MNFFKKIIKTIICFLVGFSFWYLVGVLLSKEINPLCWGIFGKLIYCIVSWGSSRSLYEKY